MAQKYVVVERKNPLKPQEAAKFYAMARSNRRVDTDEVISRVSERSSYSIGELKGCITEFLLEMKNQLALGNIVLLGDMGSFRVTIATSNRKSVCIALFLNKLYLHYDVSPLNKVFTTLHRSTQFCVLGSISACKGRYLFGIINISKKFF